MKCSCTFKVSSAHLFLSILDYTYPYEPWGICFQKFSRDCALGSPSFQKKGKLSMTENVFS